jgi:hypothetical protein
MIGLLVSVFVMVVIVSMVLHVSAGWAWIIVLAAVVALVVYRRGNPLPYTRITKTGALFSSICPFCGKHTKAAAVVCRHCGRDLVEPRTR